MVNQLFDVDGLEDLFSFIKNADRSALFQSSAIHDINFLKKTLPGTQVPVAHLLAGVYQFQLGPAQLIEVLSILDGRGYSVQDLLRNPKLNKHQYFANRVNALDVSSL